jgi:FAD/FMN-containing dehydrogenase
LAKNPPMIIHKADRPTWGRRACVRALLATGGAMALGVCAQRGVLPAFAATDPVSNLDDLARKIHGRFLRRSSPGYDEARRVWNLAYDRRPLAMVRAMNVDDVRRCVEFARNQTVPIAIRGGGHSFAGYAVADGALQIDLGALSTVTVDRAHRVASVGGVTRIRDLLGVTLAAGLYTPMGACGSVGVAGLTLAGGDTSGRGLYGTACDNLVGAQLVTADGDARTRARQGRGPVVGNPRRRELRRRHPTGFPAPSRGLSSGVVARIPMTATAYPLRGTGLSTLVAAEWHKPEARAPAERWVAETSAALRPWTRRAYVNYLPPSTPERIREIYGVNYSRLARIKLQYDPANLFRENQNIRPEVRS